MQNPGSGSRTDRTRLWESPEPSTHFHDVGLRVGTSLLTRPTPPPPPHTYVYSALTIYNGKGETLKPSAGKAKTLAFFPRSLPSSPRNHESMAASLVLRAMRRRDLASPLGSVCAALLPRSIRSLFLCCTSGKWSIDRSYTYIIWCKMVFNGVESPNLS